VLRFIYAYTFIEYGLAGISVVSDDTPTIKFPPEIENTDIVVITVLLTAHIKL